MCCALPHDRLPFVKKLCWILVSSHYLGVPGRYCFDPAAGRTVRLSFFFFRFFRFFFPPDFPDFSDFFSECACVFLFRLSIGATLLRCVPCVGLWRLMPPQEPDVLADCLLFMVRAGSWLTEFVSKEAGVAIDSSEHESSAQGLAGISKARLLMYLLMYLPHARLYSTIFVLFSSR